SCGAGPSSMRTERVLGKNSGTPSPAQEQSRGPDAEEHERCWLGDELGNVAVAEGFVVDADLVERPAEGAAVGSGASNLKRLVLAVRAMAGGGALQHAVHEDVLVAGAAAAGEAPGDVMPGSGREGDAGGVAV